MNAKLKAIVCSMLISASLLLAACQPASTSVVSSSTTSTSATSAQTTDTLTQTTSTTTVAALPANGTPPNGAPPDGNGGGGGQTTAETALADATGAYTIIGQTAAQSGQTYTAAHADQSAIYAKDSSTLTLTDVTISKTGDTSSADYSSFFGLNAGVLASDSAINMTGGTITTNGKGANGAMATGEGSSVTLTNVTIDARGDGAHAVMATRGGVMTLTNLVMNTTDAHSGAIATDRGGGTVTATGGSVTTSGSDSPAIYSTGTISVSDATLTATGAEAAVIEGSNTITLTNSTLKSTLANKWGLMLYQSFSGDAEGSKGEFTMIGGTLAYTSATGPLFYITNATGKITLNGVDVTAASGVLVQAAANDRWGTSGANGGNAVLVANGQMLSGNAVADKISTLALTLQSNSTLTGTINADHTAKSASLALDASSTWNVTADSYLTTLSDAAGISGTSVANIVGNGHTVYYDSAANPDLNGQTFTLANGGTLKPVG